MAVSPEQQMQCYSSASCINPASRILIVLFQIRHGSVQRQNDKLSRSKYVWI